MHRLAFVFTIIAVLMPGSAISQGKLISTHGDWELRCDTPPRSQSEQCVIMQVSKFEIPGIEKSEDRENVGLTVIALKAADRQAPFLRVLAPLGVLLARDNGDLGMRIDGANLGNFGFVRCLPKGCVAEISMTSSFLGKMKAGNVAKFTIHQTPQEKIAIPVSLKGFTAGYNALP
ncbi:MAG: invasion associated locus B family protein [Hyphomicrobiales bacterium]|nr:invasion associated locus B family protein [Hyphomicrobiales bacterium]